MDTLSVEAAFLLLFLLHSSVGGWLLRKSHMILLKKDPILEDP